MTEVQTILTCLADCLHDNQISEDECLGALKALRGIPAEKHMDAFMAFIGADQEQQEERPEDYLAVKTFDSREFHVGDEITDGKDKFVITGFDKTGLARVMGHTGLFGADLDRTTLKRTGRNFPAIAAIMEELTK